VAGTRTGLYFSYDGGTNWTGPCTTNSHSNLRQDITGLALSDAGGSTRIIAAVGVRGFSTTVRSGNSDALRKADEISDLKFEISDDWRRAFR
jgi:hypothetical protein